MTEIKQEEEVEEEIKEETKEKKKLKKLTIPVKDEVCSLYHQMNQISGIIMSVLKAQFKQF